MRKFIALLLLCLALLGCERDGTYDVLAQCIADSGTKFYGAFWCSHCKEQKENFGDSVDLLPYVECDPNGKNSQANVCKAKGVESYPMAPLKRASTRLKNLVKPPAVQCQGRRAS
jgi:hypothetical protein